MKKLVIIALCTFGSILGQENNFKRYLSENKAVIHLEDQNQWELLKSDAANNQFIILGESHGAQDAQLIDFNLLKYLNKTVGTKKYIAELDFAQAANINEFLEKGKEDKLKTVFRYWIKTHAQWGNQDFYAKILKIRTLNLALPKEKRIVFVGIDGVQDLENYLIYLKTFLAQTKNPIFDSLQAVLKKDYKNDADEITLFAQNYLIEIQNNKPEFQKALKDKFSIFEYLIQNLSWSNSKSGVNRPEQLFRNYKQLYTVLHLENEKLYGMWGFFHAHLVPVYYIGEDFASKLASSDHPSAKKIISVVCLPIDSQFNVWNAKTESWTKEPFSYDNKTLLQIEGIEDLKELSAETSTTLFKLNGSNSPFPKTGRLFNGLAPQGKLAGNFKTRDYGFQYVVLMRNSDWLKPLSKDF
ncbi:TraB/GumN family protein [Flavobacterium reichenbachii]|uniref:Erythromycin esterase n=1 Tax=Flavobacterium reichenbachii TaxID=362418 RepID=A0A085ZNH7_9FLAO|nr:hypothetical protein [Flavobacterium reichenbachii]KFF05991.1 hypothetical protein IW19_10860 [Flavobacterium reichenbachii]OXB14781.1 hypothetical protein B0A68_12080 [Flavobacterium reichenbachii]